MGGVASRYGESHTAAYLLPLSVDGLIVVASVCLVERAVNIRAAERSQAEVSGASLAAGGPAHETHEGPGALVLLPSDRNRSKLRTDEGTSEAQRGNVPAGVDLTALLPLARTARDELHRSGRTLTRDLLAVNPRANGVTISTSVSALLNMLRNDT